MYKQRENLDYPELTMFQMVERAKNKWPEDTAYEFFGKKVNYGEFVRKINQAAAAFHDAGIRMNDRVTICMPNTPQALVCFYALSRIGAVANMVHPLSARDEIVYYLNFSKSKMILTMDMFCEKVEEALLSVDHPVTVLVARMQDELMPHLALGFLLKTGKDFLKYPNTKHAILWKDFVLKGNGKESLLPEIKADRNRTAVILYSGGTSGVPKGICLSDYNMNAVGIQGREVINVPEDVRGCSILACMPMFHGFGLGINIHLILSHGYCCILMPTFDLKTYAKMLIKKKPNFIAGVPTLFDALLHIKDLEGVKLDFLKGMFCGGDSLPIELKKDIDKFLKAHGATIQVREGYGLTECVTASCLTPPDTYKEGSIGVPFPDMTYAIVKPGTDEVVPNGTEGEIILTGPTVMLGYLDNPDETAETLRVLEDGRTWLYTGDLGVMDDDGYVFFKQRIKRMIITNGYNVYPSQLEKVINSCEEVAYSCVIGVKDPKRMHRVKAFVVLNDGYAESEDIKNKIINELKLKIAGYALPKEIEFRKELPRTLVGKVAYRQLEEEENN